MKDQKGTASPYAGNGNPAVKAPDIKGSGTQSVKITKVKEGK